jgi:phosphate transport system substrate-binding protein
MICGAIIIGYNNYVHKISAVNEQDVNIYLYQPFSDRQAVAELDETPVLKLIDNLPVLDGATAFYPVYAAFVNAVYPKDEYDPRDSIVLCSKTTDAYNNLLEEKVDIIFCARPSEEQVKQFSDNGIDINLVPIGKDAFVFFVNKKNIVTNITIENIQGIYSGRIKNWRELGGTNSNMKAFQRPKNSGSQTALEKVMGNIPIIQSRTETVSSMEGIINEVAAYRNFNNAIGYSFLHFVTEMVQNNQIKLLSINNVYPSKETIQNGNYPFSDSFYAIYIKKEKMNENIKILIEWILSNQGQELIKRAGYIPIK